MNQSSEQQLVHNLKRMLNEGGDGNFLIVSCGDAYVQFAAKRGDTQIYCEAVSNEYLPRNKQLSDHQIAQLQQLGFDTSSDTENFSCTLAVADETSLASIAHFVVSILTDVYGCTDAKLEFELNLE